jgi:AI-2 transport protein TqsA
MPAERLLTTRLLQVAAYAVIVAWGIHAAGHIISVVLIALLLAYIYVPLAHWFMRRFHLGVGTGVLCAALLITAGHIIFTVGAVHSAIHFGQNLPNYEARLIPLLASLAEFLTRHGYPVTEMSMKGFLGSQRTAELLRSLVPAGLVLLSDRILITVLAILFTAELLNAESRVGHSLAPYSRDVRRFIAVTAQSGAINSLGNLIVYVVLGVDFPVLWSIVYFFSTFIPNVGFLFALTPPILLTLLMHGWRKAILVFSGVMIMELVTDYVLRPRLMKRRLQVSFFEVVASLVFWGSLLGPAGAVLGVPLTLAVRNFVTHRADAGGHGGPNWLSPST